MERFAGLRIVDSCRSDGTFSSTASALPRAGAVSFGQSKTRRREPAGSEFGRRLRIEPEKTVELFGMKQRPSASTIWTCHPVLNSPRAFATASTGLVKSVRMLSPSFEACTTSAAIGLPERENRKAAIGVRADDGFYSAHTTKQPAWASLVNEA